MRLSLLADPGAYASRPFDCFAANAIGPRRLIFYGSIRLGGSMGANKMDAEVIDRDRIEVFVSSSMRDEGDFSWQQLRNELNCALLKSDIFKPFAIEFHASIEPSSSYYLNHLAQSDIVIGIIRSELRPGTSRELYHAIRLRKPLLLVKLESGTSPEIDSLLRYAREMDACTYVGRPNDSGLVPYLMDQLNNVMVDLFQNRRFEIEDGGSAVFTDIAPVSIPEDVLDAFGSSVALISKKINYHADWLERKSDNPYLFFLGEKAVNWLLYGTPFSVGAFKAVILETMKDSGIPRDTLSLRLDALDASIEGRYSRCYELLQLACDSIESKDCWAYGNCLIDKRTVAGMLSEYGFGTQLTIQKKIDALSAPSYIPLALKFEEEVGTAVLNASREAMSINPYTTIRHDASLASVLSNISCLLFSSLLCGSISSALYARGLLANSLIDYSSIYNWPKLELEGIKLLVLQGDAKGFEKRFAYKSDRLRSYLPSCAEELWRLTSLTVQAYRPSTRAVVIKECAPYFSDDTIRDAWSALSVVNDFRQSASKWIKAIDMIKMRVDEKSLVNLLCQIVDQHLYTDASDVSDVVGGMDLDKIDNELVNQLGRSLKSNSDELLKYNFSAGVFGGVGKRCGYSILSEEQVERLSAVEQGCYSDNKSPSCNTETACINELRTQFDSNDRSDFRSGFSVRPSSLLCRSLDDDSSESFSASLSRVLEHCLKELPTYQGLPCSVGEAMTVLNKFACCCVRDGKALPDGWTDLISELPDEWPKAPEFRDPASMDSCAWSVRCLALKVVAGLAKDIEFLTLGIKFETLTASGQRAYLEVLEQLIVCNSICDRYCDVVSAICSSILLSEDSAVRAILLASIAAGYRRWEAGSFSDLAFQSLHDVSPNVAFKLVRLCKEGKFDDATLEQKLLGELSSDSNWFIRWHVAND